MLIHSAIFKHGSLAALCKLYVGPWRLLGPPEPIQHISKHVLHYLMKSTRTALLLFVAGQKEVAALISFRRQTIKHMKHKKFLVAAFLSEMNRLSYHSKEENGTSSKLQNVVPHRIILLVFSRSGLRDVYSSELNRTTLLVALN